MLKIQSIKVGESATNCYLIWEESSKDAVVIDPGDSADYIERVMSDLSLKPSKIIFTHGHWDHTTAGLELSLAYTIPILMGKKDSFLVNRLHPAPLVGPFLGGKGSVEIGTSKLKVIETPGHTPGSISLYSPKEKFVVTGDICFADGTFGRTDFGYSDREQLTRSLLKIKKLSPACDIYPSHGEAFKVAELMIA